MRALAFFGAGLLALASQAATAQTAYDLTYGSLSIPTTTARIVVSDTATTGTDDRQGFQILSITGTRNGHAITGTVGSAAFNFPIDNRLYPADPATPPFYDPFVNGDGIGFSVEGTTRVFNFFGAFIFRPGAQMSDQVYFEYTQPITGEFGSYGEVTATLSAAAGVPEPATWALMIMGLGAVGGAIRRRAELRRSVHFA